MVTAITTGLIVFVVVVLILFIAPRALRLAAKLAMVGIVVLMLVAGAAYGWWRGWFGATSTSAKRPTAAQTNQRANSNRRPSQR